MYQGQEKVKILNGTFKGTYGYVRSVSPFGWITIVVNGISPKVNLQPQDVEYIHHNYFLVGIEAYIKQLKGSGLNNE